MAIATQREFRADSSGTSRLVASPGDEIPAGSTAPLPPTITPGPAAHDSTSESDVVAANTAAVAAGSDATPVIGRVLRAGTVTAATFAPVAAITGASTNNRTISIVNKGQDGTGTTTVATFTFGNGTSAAAYDEKALTLSTTAANLEVAEGDILAFASIKSGTGIADPGGLVQVAVDPA